MKRKNKKNSEEEIILSNKEEEILNLYNDEYEFVEEPVKYQKKTNKNDNIDEFELDEKFEDDEEIEEFEEVVEKSKKEKKKKEKKKKEKNIEEFIIIDEEAEPKKKKEKNPINTRINIVFALIIIIILAVTVDIIAVSKYEKGPFLAIPLHTYKDGGSKAYYGLGYKVIKYNATNGKKCIKLGSWFMKYNNKPIETNIIDLAIEFANDESFSYKKYLKEYVKISGTLESVSEKENTMTISYRDTEGDKYTLVMECNMSNDDDIKKVSTDEYITISGTINKYDFKTKKKPGKLYLNNCYLQD